MAKNMSTFHHTQSVKTIWCRTLCCSIATAASRRNKRGL